MYKTKALYCTDHGKKQFVSLSTLRKSTLDLFMYLDELVCMCVLENHSLSY